jgi:ketosteroid isomerase-like protein
VDKAATIRRFLELCDRKDWDAIEEFIGDGYSWLDHTVGTVSRTPEELAIGMSEDDAWQDPHFEVHHLTEGTDGRVFVQMTRTGTLPPGREWRGIQGTGQEVTREQIDIISFDDEGKIVGEEGYEDALSIMRQLGKMEP